MGSIRKEIGITFGKRDAVNGAPSSSPDTITNSVIDLKKWATSWKTVHTFLLECGTKKYSIEG